VLEGGEQAGALRHLRTNSCDILARSTCAHSRLMHAGSISVGFTRHLNHIRLDCMAR
jgi:hypothetical protein